MKAIRAILNGIAFVIVIVGTLIIVMGGSFAGSLFAASYFGWSNATGILCWAILMLLLLGAGIGLAQEYDY